MRIKLYLALACVLFATSIHADESLVDSRNQEFPARAPVQRVVALAPHITELFFAAGAGDLLVGAVEYSDYPEQAKHLPRVGDAFRVDLEKIALLSPDLVAVWESGTPVALQEKLEDLGLPVFSFEVGMLEDVAESLKQVGKLTGRIDKAKNTALAYREELSKLRQAHSGKTKLSFFYQISDRPLFTVNGNHFISNAMEVCGGINIFDDLDALAPSVAIESVIARNPQLIIAGQFPGMAESPLEMWQKFPTLAATAGNNLYLVDAELVARSTPRIISGIKQVCLAFDEARAKINQYAH